MLLPRILAGTLSLAGITYAAVSNTTADTQAADPQGEAKSPSCPQPGTVTVIKPAVTVTNTYTPPAVTVTKSAVTITQTYTPPVVTVTKSAVTVTVDGYVKSTVTLTNTVTKPGTSVTVTTTRTADGGYGGTT